MIDWENERRKWDTAGEDYGSGRLAHSEPSSGRGSSDAESAVQMKQRSVSRNHPPALFRTWTVMDPQAPGQRITVHGVYLRRSEALYQSALRVPTQVIASNLRAWWRWRRSR